MRWRWLPLLLVLHAPWVAADGPARLLLAEQLRVCLAVAETRLPETRLPEMRFPDAPTKQRGEAADAPVVSLGKFCASAEPLLAGTWLDQPWARTRPLTLQDWRVIANGLADGLADDGTSGGQRVQPDAAALDALVEDLDLELGQPGLAFNLAWARLLRDLGNWIESRFGIDLGLDRLFEAASGVDMGRIGSTLMLVLLVVGILCFGGLALMGYRLYRRGLREESALVLPPALTGVTLLDLPEIRRLDADAQAPALMRLLVELLHERDALRAPRALTNREVARAARVDERWRAALLRLADQADATTYAGRGPGAGDLSEGFALVERFRASPAAVAT